MRRRVLQLLSSASAVVLLGLVSAPVPVSATSVSGNCPTTAATFPISANVLPPYPAGTPITDLVGCTTPFAPSSSTNVRVAFGNLGLVDDGCSAVTAISLTSTGTPAGNGWIVVAFNTATGAEINVGTGQDGFFQQWNATAGQTITGVGYTFVSPSAQPASGSFAVTDSLNPAGISLADLVAGRLGAALLILDGPSADAVASITASVTTDSSPCSTPPPAPPTTPADAVVGVTPQFTG